MFFKRKKDDLKELNKQVVELVNLQREGIYQGGLSGPLNFMIILVDDSCSQSLAEAISTCVTLINEHRGVVSTVSSSLIVATFGFPFNNSGATDRIEAALALKTRVGDAIRIVHGVEDGWIGNQGTAKVMHYGPRIPAFGSKLETLVSLLPGGISDLSK